MANTPSLKRLQIDKATSTMIAVASVAAFVTIFCIISSHSLLTLLAYQNKVISAKQQALNQLTLDVTTSKKLVTSYKNFDDTSNNLLGSPTTGTAQNSGDNAKIILDALPSAYDYPALTTSLQSLLSNQGVNVSSIGGTDQQASITVPGSQTTTPVATASTPVPTTSSAVGGAVGMPFTFSVDGPYQNLQGLIATFEKSIRPFQFETLDFSGNQSDVSLTATAQTFYKPATSFKITTETVK